MISPPRLLFAATAALVVLTLTTVPSSAQTSINWANNSGAGSTDWFTGTNWVGGTVPGNLDTAIFPNTSTINAQPDIGAGAASVSRISFDNTGGDWSLTGTGTITLNSTATAVGTAPFSVLGGGSSTIQPALSLPGTRFLYVTGGSTATFDGNITGTALLQLRVQRGSTIQLNGANSFTSGVSLSTLAGEAASGSGVFRLGSNTAFGTGSVVSNGGTANVTSIAFEAVGGDRQIANSVRVHPNTFIVQGANTLDFTGSLAPSFAAASRDFQSEVTAADKWFRVSGTLGLRVDGDGTVGQRGLRFVGNGRVDLTGVVQDRANGAVGEPGRLVVGSGNGGTLVRLANPNNTYTGDTVVNSGELRIAAGGNVFGTATSDVLVGDVGTIVPSVYTDGAVTVTRNVRISPLNTAFNVNLGGRTADVSEYAGNIVFDTGTGAASAATRKLDLRAVAGGRVDFTGQFQRRANYTGFVTLEKLGSGTVRIGPATSNLTSSTLAVSGGALEVTGSFGVSSGVTVGNPTTGALLRVDGAGVLSAGTNVTVTPAGILSGDGTISSPVNVNAGGELAPGGATIGVLSLGGTATVTGGTAAALGGTVTTTLNLRANGIAPNTPETASATDADRLALTGGGPLNLVIDGSNRLRLEVTRVGGVDYTLFSPVSYVIATGSGAASFQKNGSQWDNGTSFVAGEYEFAPSGFEATDFSLSVQGTNFVLTFTPVPEPGPVAGVAAAGLAVVGWRRKRRAA